MDRLQFKNTMFFKVLHNYILLDYLFIFAKYYLAFPDVMQPAPERYAYCLGNYDIVTFIKRIHLILLHIYIKFSIQSRIKVDLHELIQ